MNQVITRKLLGLVALIVLPVLMWGQGVTTSSMNGRVTDQSGKALVGATVVATHTPSGSVYGNNTNGDGYFRIANMRVGGPYTVKVTYVGYDDFMAEGIFLNLGQAYRLDVKVAESGVAIGEVEITSSRSDIFDGNRTGAETVVTEAQINALPTVARAIGDFARLTPQATVREGGDGFSISIAGQNNRYNAVYIDGAVNNDVFGLAGSGTNGGQTGVSPISLDAIEEFQISVAPFDVRVGGFAGGAINAVTRSGSNNIEASVYGFFRNQGTAGLTPDRPERGKWETDNPGLDYTDEFNLADFGATTAGFRIGGPIIKDKAFFFLNAELQREETPLPVTGDYIGNSNTDDLNQLITKIQSFGYDPGEYDNARQYLNSNKITAKLDFNLNQNNKLSIRHGYVFAENLEGVRSSSTRIRFLNESEYFVSSTNSTAIELNSIINNEISNNLKVGLTFVRDDRDPYQGEESKNVGEDGDPNYFPYVTILDGAGRITFGSEQFSTANALDQNVITITDNLEIYTGRHNITIGTHNEFFSVYNLFIRQNYGVYEFNDLDDFLGDSLPGEFFRSYSLVDDITGDGSAAASEFSGAQFGAYIQDEFQVNPNFKLTGGLRFDLPVYFTDQPENTDFNTNTIPLLEAAGYDLLGAQTGQFIDPQLLISPRVGFNWDVNGAGQTQVRGGIGIFTSRIPLVWPGGAFNNNGRVVGGDFTTSVRDDWFRPYTQFNPDWRNQPQAVAAGAGQPSGQIDLFASNFKVPRILKANLAVDQKLPWGLILSLEGIFNQTLQGVAYQNLNLKPSTENLEGTGDDRPIFDRRDEIDDTYSRIMLGYNVQQGYTYNVSVSLTKPFDNGLSGTIAYSYGDAFSIFDGTSSQNSSQWRGLHSIDGRNFDQALQRSDFAQGHRVIAGISYALDWNKARNATTTFSIFYEGVSGQPYSYIYSNGDDIQNEDSRNRALVYVPVDQNDIVLTDPADWDALNTFIENDAYLSTRRGMYAERNASRTPFASVLDLKVIQDVRFFSGGKTHNLQLTVDIFNFTNLINKNWGRRWFIPGGSAGYPLMNFDGFQEDALGNETNIPTFSLNNLPDEFPRTDFDDGGIQSSRWQAQFGVRYIFE